MSTTDDAGSTDPSDAARIHALAAEFDADWQPDAWDRMSELARRAPPHLVRAVIEELIAVDVRRRAAHGLTEPAVRSYLNRFPDLAADPKWQDRVLSGPTAPSPGSPIGRAAPVPERIGRYPVNSLLAAGGEAVVYLCFHPDWKGQVVVKWMRPEAATRADWRERFGRQGELLKGLEHPNIVRVYDQGEADGRPFVVTEYIQGRTLEQYARDTRPDPARAVELVADVASALGYAHRFGIYHQDVKPVNVLVDESGRAKLIDFGVAWFRPAWGGGADPKGGAAGTLAYLSPEQAGDGEITARTDVFALGGVLLFLLTGSPPYPTADAVEAIRRARACDWERHRLSAAGVPAGLRHVCETAMAADPADRYPSAEALAAAAAAAVRRPWYRSPRWIATATILLAVFVAAVVVGRGLSDRSSRSGQPVAAEGPNLTVQVLRPGFDPKPLSEVVPLQTGDTLQARFRVPAGVYACLAYVNGAGRLEVIQSYLPRDTAQDAVWPAAGRGVTLEPPVGTEALFVCGRADRAPTAAELQEAWASDGGWPALEPAGRFLRVRAAEVTVEGAKGRDLGGETEFPDGDRVKGRLEQFRSRLRDFPLLEGLAFRHR